MLIRDAFDRYKDVHVCRLKRAREIIAMAESYLQPVLLYEMDQLTKYEVAKRHAQLGALYPTTANRVVSIIRCMYQCMLSLDLYHGPNPAVGIKRFPEHPRKRVVQPGEEMLRLLQSISAEPTKEQAFLWLLITTAVRRSEARFMEWVNLDERTGAWLIPETKNKRPHQVVIPPFVLAKFSAISHHGPYVFATRTGKPWNNSNIWHLLNRVCARANIVNLRLHDLRRTLASWMEDDGVPIQDIQKTLNHASIRSTQIYLEGLNPAPAVKRTITRHTDKLMAYVETDPAKVT